jgi:putative phosphonate metabolism protein
MTDPIRYALYYVPPAASDLYRFGASAIGYDAYAGKDLAFPGKATAAFADWRELTSEPRKYGFHATLKAPFALKDGTTEADLIAAIDAFAETPRTIPEIAPVVRAIGRFVAIVPDASATPLSAFADACVTAFDGFRAPLTERDRKRRLASPLSDSQIELLDRWGYPYVFEEFRFHMTLTGGLPQDKREPAQAFLHTQFNGLGLQSIAIDTLTLLRQDRSDARFVVIKQAALRRG